MPRLSASLDSLMNVKMRLSAGIDKSDLCACVELAFAGTEQNVVLSILPTKLPRSFE